MLLFNTTCTYWWKKYLNLWVYTINWPYFDSNDLNQTFPIVTDQICSTVRNHFEPFLWNCFNATLRDVCCESLSWGRYCCNLQLVSGKHLKFFSPMMKTIYPGFKTIISPKTLYLVVIKFWRQHSYLHHDHIQGGKQHFLFCRHMISEASGHIWNCVNLTLCVSHLIHAFLRPLPPEHDPNFPERTHCMVHVFSPVVQHPSTWGSGKAFPDLFKIAATLTGKVLLVFWTLQSE